MRVILATDTIRAPLAGVGRYAWELASRLPQIGDIQEVKYLAHGRWRSFDQVQASAQRSQSTQTEHSLTQRLVQAVAANPVGSKIYAAYQKRATAQQLAGETQGIFHGPSFFLPPTRLKKVVTIHDLSAYVNPNWHPKTRIARLMKVIPASIQAADMVITDTETVRQEMIQRFGLLPEKVKAVLIGVDQRYHPHTSSEIAATLRQYHLNYGAYTLFVSTIEPRKNIVNLLQAYRQLNLSTRQAYPLVIAGGAGWNSEQIHAQIRVAQAEGWLKYLGYTDEQDMPALYAGSRLFAYPSWYEGFGLPLAEAMASGVPVVTSNRSCMPEVCAGAAQLVDPANIDSIQAGLELALNDEAWRTQAISKGLQRAKELTWDRCAQETAQVYRELVGHA